MSSEEMQKEELEVLSSIYEGDTAFKQINDTTFQYKFGEDGEHKSFMVEVSWPEEYPDVEPQVNLEVFYNKHILPSVKEAIKAGMLEQAADLLGMSMTFSLFEWVKDNVDSLVAEQPDKPVLAVVSTTAQSETTEDTQGKKDKEKKEHLTKSQKRRIFDRFGATNDRPRGWNWVDIIKHLSQTGGQRQDES